MKTDKLKKNTMQHPIILLLTAALLAGCGSKTNPTPTDAKIQWGKQDVAAVAFVGYFTYASDFLASSTYKMYTEQYGLQDVQLVENKGDEIYLVIPRDPKASVAVNDYPEALMTDPERRLRPNPLQKRRRKTLLHQMQQCGRKGQHRAPSYRQRRERLDLSSADRYNGRDAGLSFRHARR